MQSWMSFELLMRVDCPVRRALHQCAYFYTMTCEQLDVFMAGTLPGEEVLKKEQERVLWNPILNSAVKSIKKPNYDSVVAQRTLIKRLFTWYMKGDECKPIPASR